MVDVFRLSWLWIVVLVNEMANSRTRLYSIWGNMWTRCTNNNSTYYHKYGAKGIEVDPDWKDFEVFKSWSELNRYEDSLEIDRIDNQKGYNPENCRWVDLFTQAYNKGMYESNTSGTTGVNWISRDNKWQSRISVKGRRISLGMYKSLDDAIKARQEAEIKYYGELKHEQSDCGTSN